MSSTATTIRMMAQTRTGEWSSSRIDCLLQELSQPLQSLRRAEAQLAKAGYGPSSDSGLLVVFIIGDEHDRRSGERRVGFDGLDDVQAVAVVLVEPAIDQDQVKNSRLQLC